MLSSLIWKAKRNQCDGQSTWSKIAFCEEWPHGAVCYAMNKQKKENSILLIMRQIPEEFFVLAEQRDKDGMWYSRTWIRTMGFAIEEKAGRKQFEGTLMVTSLTT